MVELQVPRGPEVGKLMAKQVNKRSRLSSLARESMVVCIASLLFHIIYVRCRCPFSLSPVRHSEM